MTSVEQTVGIARMYSDGRQYRQAADILGTALQQNPDSAALLVEMARAQLGLDNPEAAASSAFAALSVDPGHVYAMRVYALALDQLGQRHDALTLAYRAVLADSHNYLTHYTYGMLLLNAGHFLQAYTAAVEALRGGSADPEVHFLCGRILNKLGRLEESTVAYQEALRLDPEHASAEHNIAVNRLNRGHWSRALTGFLGAGRMDPELGEHVRRNVGVALIRPMRWVTLMVLVTAYFAIVSHQPGAAAPRVITVIAAIVTVALLVRVVRPVPRAALRSVMRARPMLAVRGGLAVYAVVVGVLSASGLLAAVSLPAAVVLLLATILTILIGWLTRT
ncbi:tetratricopeptide repeat protein [Mycobacterium sp. MS1601]|uniref:tetratricopeptide repeat protein n=1 Tax=Mycobacterium sp. MS1601 TaxID=1936029 RepID=UPI0012FA932F|nr:tetratricopeptide repeat protein [Mycobacterium sp. MS1601]